MPAAQYAVSDIKCEMVRVVMRDGTRLATDCYFPPVSPAPVIVMRTPYGRSADVNIGVFLSFVRRGYVVIAQDCRGTGNSEPDSWDYTVYEPEDSFDLVDWIRKQPWCDGFIASLGASYVGQTQWCMATHPAMTTIVPTVSGLGFAFNTARFYMFLNAYSRSVGKGKDKLPVPYYEMERLILQETMAGGYFRGPLHVPLPNAILQQYPQLCEWSPSSAKRWLWEKYCSMNCAQRAELIKSALAVENITSVDVESLPALFGHHIAHDAHALPHATHSERCKAIKAVPMLITGWYDWFLNDTLATWTTFRSEAHANLASRARLVITPYAHNVQGYHEGVTSHAELMRPPGIGNQVSLLLHWYASVRDSATEEWPHVLYYLMGANEWRVSSDWPLLEAKEIALYLNQGGGLTSRAPDHHSEPSCFVYDPRDPTPTVGGSIVSYVYPPGSVDVSDVQSRADVVVFTTPLLEQNLDVVGPLRVILYASSTAADTDFVARLSDVFPDGRAIQLQAGLLRARYRNLTGEPEFLIPEKIYRFDIDLWATANRFKAGHRLRVDISSADFPRFDRNSNLGLASGDPTLARQRIYHDSAYPSCLLASVLEPVGLP